MLRSGALSSGRACTVRGGDVAPRRGHWGQGRVLTGGHTGGVTEWGPRSLRASGTGRWGRMGMHSSRGRRRSGPQGDAVSVPVAPTGEASALHGAALACGPGLGEAGRRRSRGPRCQAGR